MDGDTGPNVIYLLLLLMLVASSLFARRLPIRNTLKMALAWAAIFGVVFVLIVMRDDFAGIGQKLRAEVTGEPVASGDEVRIRARDDGHFWVQARVNGKSALFLIDSGATITTVSSEFADQAGLETGMRVDQVDTANGPVLMKRSYADAVALGPIERPDLAIDINPGDSVNVLGMNFLSSLAGWRVEGNTLVLRG